jgi:hypothetical protein
MLVGAEAHALGSDRIGLCPAATGRRSR